MNALGPKKREIIMIAIIIAAFGLAFVCFYSIFLLNNLSFDNETQESIDIYNQKLQYDLGVSGDNYEERALYTNDMYELDRIQLIKNAQNQRYDLLEDDAKYKLSKYQFDNELLYIYSSLSQCSVFEDQLDDNGNIEKNTVEKIRILSSILDPELYMWFFLAMDVTEQAQMIRYDNVNILPDFEYEEAILVYNHDTYEVHLKYRSQEYIAYMIMDGSLNIIKVDNTSNTMNGLKYNIK